MPGRGRRMSPPSGEREVRPLKEIGDLRGVHGCFRPYGTEWDVGRSGRAL